MPKMQKPAQRAVKFSEISCRDFKLFFSYFKPHLNLFVADLVCAFFISAVDVAFPTISRFVINSLLPNFLEDPLHTKKFFFAVIFLCALAYFLSAICNWFVIYFGHLFGVKVESDMRRDLFSHLQNQSFSFFDSNRTGKIMSAVTYDLFEVSELAHHGPEDFFISILTLAGSFFVLINVRKEIGIVILFSLPLMILRAFFSRRALMNSSAEVKEKTAQINNQLESAISGIRVTKAFTNEDYEKNEFKKCNAAFVFAKRKYYKAMATFHSRMHFTTHILNVLVLALGGFFIMQKKMTIGDLVMANLFVSAFLQPIRRLTNLAEQFSTGMAGFLRFSALMNSHFETEQKSLAKNLGEKNKIEGKIEFKNVSFAYKNDFPVLKNVSFVIEKGETLAFVGPSGGGKTTLGNLIPRFYEITSGKIEIDGIDIRDVTLKSLRRQIGIVDQNVFLFADTILQNIAYGKPEATFFEIEEAAKRAEIYEDIIKMPEGFNTIVGERGLKLSGGQKQRVAIARVFLKNPPILILDEATSALDSVTESRIQSAFDELSKGRTTLIIAHRLSTIKNANKIAVIDGNHIAEIGIHEELMQKNGIYANLCAAQKNFA